MNEIRKISVGVDYKNSMHYVVGQQVLSDYNIHAIMSTENGYVIWIEKGDEILCWKEININVPVIIEYNINF